MPVKNRFAELLPEITEWRRDLHENPEILFDTHRTSAIVAEKLKAFGCDDIVTGIGRTGVVGVIKGKSNGSGMHCRFRNKRALNTRPKPTVRCMPAGMTGTPRCCWVPRNTYPRRAILTAQSS
jgi:hypothetical protein